MGVLETRAWPMSHEPIYDRPQSSGLSPGSSSSRRAMRESGNNCLECRHLRRELHHHQQNHSSHQNYQNQSLRHFQENSDVSSSGPLGFRSGHASQLEVMSQTGSVSHPASESTGVSWLKKVKVFKKIQQKITGKQKGGICLNNLPPLLFSDVHGENVSLSQNGAVATRIRSKYSHCYGVVFSNRPVKIKEKVSLKLVELSRDKEWKGALRFGFTSQDPASLRNRLPKQACPDLTSRPGFWAKALDESHVREDAVLHFYVNSAGDVRYGIDGKEKGVFFRGVDTRRPLWVLIDIYGITTGIEFFDPRSHLNCSSNNLETVASSFNARLTSPPPPSPPIRTIECVACCERPVDSVFYSCGHMCMCYHCALEYWDTTEETCCPLCRAPINDIIRTYT